MPTAKTFLVIPQEGHGHVNACIGVAQQLVTRGHRVVVAFERAWRAVAEKLDDQLECAFYVDPTRSLDLAANEYWLNFMEKSCSSFGIDPLEAIEKSDLDQSESALYSMLNIDQAVGELIKQLKPDVIILDTYKSMPSIINSGCPWVWLTSAGPLSCLSSPLLPPCGTGYPTNGDPTVWQLYRTKAAHLFGPAVERYQRRLVEMGGPKLAPGERMAPSPYLNIYAYPLELDYLDIRPLPDDTWLRFDHFIRKPSAHKQNQLNEMSALKSLETLPGKLVYVSMGTLGCADSRLMLRLVDLLAACPHRFLLSLGPKVKNLISRIPNNIVGSEWFNQIDLLPHVDLVITHGGNNTLLEALYFGRPLLALPLFGDQFDNAQRLAETRLGLRLNPYRCTPDEMAIAINQLLNDQRLATRLEVISCQMRNSKSTQEAAAAIEQLAN